MEVPRPSGAGSFELVGHDPLLNRGMNAAIATRGDRDTRRLRLRRQRLGSLGRD